MCRAPFRTACRNSEGGVRCPRADSFFANPLPGGSGSLVDRHKDRSARSVLNRGSVRKAKRAKHPSANAAGNPVLGLSHRVEPVASAASESAERRRAARRAARSRAWRGHWLDNAPFGAPLPCFLRMILSENRTPLFGIMRRGKRIFVAWWLPKLGCIRIARTDFVARHPEARPPT